MTEADRRTKHPSELLIANSLNRAEYHRALKKNEILLFNLPQGTTEQQIKELVSKASINFKILNISTKMCPNSDRIQFMKLELPNPNDVSKL